MQGAAAGRPASEALTSKVRINILKPALQRLQIRMSERRVERLFQTQDLRRGQKSARKLRDQIVHQLSVRDIEEVLSRQTSLIADMGTFIERVAKAAPGLEAK